jgi:hypothetical protein
MTDVLTSSFGTRRTGSKLYDTWVASAAEATIDERRKARRAAERDYRLVSAAAFPVFLAIATLARLLPREARVKLCGGRRSILGDARAMVASTISIAFTA